MVANDTVYVGPGVYREQLTMDVSGGAGTPITYIGDVTGENTNDVGGLVRITGSDDDQTGTRSRCIYGAAARNYRTFRGFMLDGATSAHVQFNGSTGMVIEDCYFADGGDGGVQLLVSDTTPASAVPIIRRCFFLWAGTSSLVEFDAVADVNIGGYIENCIFAGGKNGIAGELEFDDTYGTTVRNCTFLWTEGHGILADNVTATNEIYVNNCLFSGIGGYAVNSDNVNVIIEDYNNFWGNTLDRFNVSTGLNSTAYMTLWQPPTLHAGASQVSGFRFPWWFGELSEWSQVKQILGSGEPAVDLFGIARPATAEKNSWGPMQFVDRELESGTVYAGTYGRVIQDAGQTFVRRIPVTGVEITVTLYMRRSTNYEGNVPRMVIKQPGQADEITNMTAAVNTWEQLSDTFTPASEPGFIEVWAESRHAPTFVDDEQGNLSYTTDGAEQTFTDDGQDFSDYDTDPTVADAIAAYYIIVTNDDGTTAKGWIREVGGGGNTEITVCNEQRLNDSGTVAPAMWIGQYAAKTPSTYDVFETAYVYYDVLDVS